MTPDLEKEIFADALELDPTERAAFLDERCGADREMHDRLRRLLDAHEHAREFMGAPTIDTPPVRQPATDPLPPGTEIGPYTLETTLGEGGFGKVFRARQSRPVSRLVAIKILKSGIDAPAVAARMQAERQALAVMDHPGIARIFDAGQTPGGLPYFVMEYVDGEPLTHFCRRANLSIRQRLELFERVCLAVQHAHHKGIIHRDLKPSNVLVTIVDGRPEPRVIDFGIAKAIGPAAADATIVTAAGHIVGTPAYMSPEQVAGPGGLDTRSDVYALGVMLYELLTGSLPFDKARLSEAPIATLARIICDETPPRPSARALDTSPGRDNAERRRLAAELKGELDWIVMRAIEKEPARRYPSANALALDIRRHLNDEPVDAGPPSGLYRFGKFARRHRGELAAAAVAFAALLALLITSVVYGLRTEDQRRALAAQLEKSQAFARFTTDMLAGVDPAVARGEDRTLLRRILEDSIARIEAEPPESPEVEAEIRELLGISLTKIALFEQAAEQFKRAHAIAAEVLGEEHPATIRLLASLGTTHIEASRFDDARRELGAALVARRRTLGDDHPDTIDTLFNLAMLHLVMGEPANARDAFIEVLERRQRVLGENHSQTMSARNSLATVLSDLGEHERAIALFERVVEHQTSTLGEDHPHTLATRNNLADALAALGRVDEAIEIMEDALLIKRRILGPNHPSIVTSLNNLASAYRRVDRLDQAGDMLTQAADICRTTFGESDRRTLIVTNNLASFLVQVSRPDEALDLLELILPISEETLGRDHPLSLAILANTARALLAFDRPDDALLISQTLMTRGTAALPPDHPNQGEHNLLFGEALLKTGRIEEARPHLEAAVRILSGTPSPPRARLEHAASLIAELDTHQAHSP